MKLFLLLIGFVNALTLQAAETSTGAIGKMILAGMSVPTALIESKIPNLDSIVLEKEGWSALVEDNKKDLLKQSLLFVKAPKISPKDKERFFTRLDAPITEFSDAILECTFYEFLLNRALPLASKEDDKAAMKTFVMSKREPMAGLLQNLIEYAAHVDSVGGYESGCVEAYDFWLSKKISM